MDSILRAFFRQIEELLRLTSTSVHAFQLQTSLKNDRADPVDDACAFTHDLRSELRLARKHLQSTCFALQRALYRLQASAHAQTDASVRVPDSIVVHYESNLSEQLRTIDEMLSSIVEVQSGAQNSSVIALQVLFQQIRENLDMLLTYLGSMRAKKSTLYLEHLVSDTLERFYLIAAALGQLIRDIEQIDKKTER